jgi:dynein light intermediate chain 1
MIKLEKQKSMPSQNLWDTILSEASVLNNSQNGHLVLIGNKNCGKRTFVNQIMSNVSKGSSTINKLSNKGVVSALDYTYQMIRNPDDPDNELMSKMNIWVFDDSNFKELLAGCIREDTVTNTVIGLCVDLSEPWKIQQTLAEWMQIIIDRLTKVLTNLPLAKQDEMRAALKEYMINYSPPQFDEEGRLKTFKQTEENEKNGKIELPLPPGLLTTNYGIPIMIIGMKSDILEDIEKEKDGENKLEYLHYTLRNYALPYGATLIYTSAKVNSNLDIFYDYVGHRFFGFGLKYKPEIIHRDSIFIPSGYDNEKLLHETFTGIKTNMYFEDVFPAPKSKAAGQKDEVLAEEHQGFLLRLKDKLGTSTTTTAATTAKSSITSLDQASSIQNMEEPRTMSRPGSILLKPDVSKLNGSFVKGDDKSPINGIQASKNITTPASAGGDTSNRLNAMLNRLSSGVNNGAPTQSIEPKPSPTQPASTDKNQAQPQSAPASDRIKNLLKRQ